MSTTPRFAFSIWDEGNTEPNLVFNQLAYAIDALLQSTVINRTTAAPPATPAIGDAYIVAAAATGAWTGHTNAIAVAVTGGWIFFTPTEGWGTWSVADVKKYNYVGGVWTVDASSGALTNPMSAVDDIIVGGTAGTPLRKAKGANGTALGVVAGALGYFAAAFLGVANLFTKNQAVTPVALAIAAGVVAVDASLSNNFTLSLTANVTSFTFSNLSPGMVINLCLDQDATGGRTVALPSTFHSIGTAPTLATTANAKAFLSLYWDGTIFRYGGGSVA
jgi:hypothetical protein